MAITLDYNKSELELLKEYLQKGDIASAIELVDELDDTSKAASINKISSYMAVVLAHLVKQNVEKRTTNSWDVSIQTELYQINKERISRGTKKPLLATDKDLASEIEGAYNIAVKTASLEALGGSLHYKELAKIVDKTTVLKQALDLIKSYTDQ